ncbi:MAG: N-acetylmuramoyl-L-alanine amidase [Clostridia bacterium]|nr:N-acetylmuramoyl-L-alanine amidase [Clostridia bacterium]
MNPQPPKTPEQQRLAADEQMLERRRIARERLAAERRAKAERQRRMTMLVFAVTAVVMMIGVIAVVIASRRDVPAAADTQPPDETAAEGLITPLGDFTVCIDPGHGYGDEGARSQVVDGVVEREVNLDVALRLRDLLESVGVTVSMTHDTNTPPDGEESSYTIDLETRMNIANSFGADRFVSIHCDSYPADTSVSGVRIYYVRGRDADSLASQTADAIAAELEGSTPRIMPMNENDTYYVIRVSEAPGLLVEIGFLSNPEEAASMLDEDWKQSMALGIANGLIHNLNEGLET